MFDQFYQYLIKNKLIYPGQSGFLKKRSTLACLLKTTDDWTRQWRNGGSVFTDLKKAFETVDHDLIYRKLENSAKNYNSLQNI